MRFFLLLFPLLLLSETLRLGDMIEKREFTDQNDTVQSLYASQKILVAWDKNTTLLANQYFDNNATLITNKKISLLIDLSKAPKGLLLLFVLPGMREHKHTILLSYNEEFSQTLPFKEGHLTLISLDEFKISNVIFIHDKEKLTQILGIKP